jgi:hypothetical protein
MSIYRTKLVTSNRLRPGWSGPLSRSSSNTWSRAAGWQPTPYRCPVLDAGVCSVLFRGKGLFQQGAELDLGQSPFQDVVQLFIHHGADPGQLLPAFLLQLPDPIVRGQSNAVQCPLVACGQFPASGRPRRRPVVAGSCPGVSRVLARTAVPDSRLVARPSGPGRSQRVVRALWGRCRRVLVA